MNGYGGNIIRSEVERDRNSMRMELGGIVVRLEKGDVEDGMNLDRVGEQESEGGFANCSIDSKRSELFGVELVRWSHSLDVATEEPDEVAGLEAWPIGNTLIVITCLDILGMLEFGTQLSVEMLKASGEI